MRARVILQVLLILISFQTASGSVLKLVCTDSRGEPVGDAIIYIDCRHNFFFTDEHGIALIWIDDLNPECIVTVDRPELVGKDMLVKMDESKDTTSIEMMLYRWEDPELLIPNDPQSRFTRMLFCADTTRPSLVESVADDRSVFRLWLPVRENDDQSEMCCLTLSDDERIITDFYGGYQLETATKVVFSARSIGGAPEVRFFSLYYGCQSTPGSYPVIEATLSEEFTEYEIDITRWNRSSVQSIWGCSSSGSQSPIVEIRDLRIIHQRPSGIVGSR